MAKVTTWTTALLGVLLAAAAFQQSELATKWTPILTAIVAGSAVIQLLCDRHATTLDERLKRTPPKLTVKAVRESPEKVKFGVLSDNLIPFECQWFTCREDNQVVGPIPVDWTKFIPSKSRQAFVATYDLQVDKAQGPLRLFFHFRSPYCVFRKHLNSCSETT